MNCEQSGGKMGRVAALVPDDSEHPRRPIIGTALSQASGKFTSSIMCSPVLCRRCSGARLIHVLGSLCTITTCRSPHVAGVASETILAPLGGHSMHDPASELRRIPIPRTPVNKDKKKGLSCYAPALLVSKTPYCSRRNLFRCGLLW